MALSDADVRHVARLARLGLAPGEAERFRDELARILDHVSQIGELDLAGVPPTSHVVEVANALRADEPKPSLSRDVVFEQAPATQEGGFLVPSPGAGS